MSLATLLAPGAGLLRRSVVQVRVGAGGGAGVVWDAEGAVVTNAHVAQAARVTVVRPDGAAVSGEVERRGLRRGLALGRAAVGLPPVPTPDPAGPRPGELVFAIGHPMGVNEAVSAGVFQALGPLPDGLVPALAGRRQRWVQAGVHLAPGNSGGPLADAHGRVIGVAAMIAGGLALAVPSTDVRAFLSRRPLGVAVRPVPARDDVPRGLRVDHVVRGSPASDAGVAPGDILVGGGTPPH